MAASHTEHGGGEVTGSSMPGAITPRDTITKVLCHPGSLALAKVTTSAVGHSIEDLLKLVYTRYRFRIAVVCSHVIQANYQSTWEETGQVIGLVYFPVLFKLYIDSSMLKCAY